MIGGIMKEQSQQNFVAEPNEFLSPRFQNSPYYVTCLNSFAHDDSKVIRPYEAAFIADLNGMPLAYDPMESNPKFLDIVYGTDVEAEAEVCVEQPAKEKKAKGGVKLVKRRALVLFLVFLFSAIALAIPVISSLAILPDYINIGVDVLTIADIFGGELGLDTITDNLPIILTALFMVFSLISVIISLLALFTKKKKCFGIIALFALVAAVAFALAGFQFDFNAAIGGIAGLDYGVYAMVGCPLLILILSLFGYKKIK
jgi:hypothetical protein